MTTLVFDGRIIAADSRSSMPEQKHAHEDSDVKRICLHCEKSAWTGTDSMVKLVVGSKSQWEGERIIAAATAGTSKDCNVLRSLLLLDHDIRRVWDARSILADKSESNSFSASMLVVTQTKLWSVEFRGSSIRSFEHPRNLPFAMGSGKDAALLAMTSFGANAVNAVWSARAIDPATGGPVRWFDTSEFNPDDEKTKYKVQVEEAMTRLEAVEYVKNGFLKPATPKPSTEKVAVKKPTRITR
jgi:hypothetical protein